MTTYVKLQFINNEILLLSTSSFLFKQSKLFQSIDIDEDNTIPILCSRSYILDENERYLFNDKTDLSFMLTLLPNKFIEVCKFLDTICYENTINNFSVHFIIYVMKNLKEEINIIKYFMQPEIRSIINYLNNECIDLQIKSCTPAFYFLYLTEYKEEVIKYNRIDIYELLTDKSEYYRYINKYDNNLTYIVKETQEYNDYVIKISEELIDECKRPDNTNNIIKLVEQGAVVNLQNKYGCTALLYACIIENYLEVIKYLIKQGANVNLQNNYGYTALHHASYKNKNLEVVKYLIEYGTNINLQNNIGNTALHIALQQKDNLEVIRYLVEQGANINLQNNDGYTALHIASQQKDNLEVIKYLVTHGANVNLYNNYYYRALHYASQLKNNKEVINYLVTHGANVNLYNNDGYTALHYASQLKNNKEVINYLQQFN